ncbi:MAG: hypothetical protein MI723_17810 [Caulobacterales bacterium]|nr:hypothetical protein [Caulobacterales bacterium]
MRYDYVPITKRAPLRFPGGKRVAVIVTFNLETWDLVKDYPEPYYAGGPAILPDLLPGNIADFPNYTWREYGQRVGVFRMFEALDRHGVKPSCTVNAVTCQRRFDMVEAALERGCELVAHNFEQGELLWKHAHDMDAERRVIETTLRIYEETIGRKAKGWLSSSLRGTTNTAEILVENGCTYYCDIMNDEQPYLIHTNKGAIVSTPYSNEINDFTLVTRRGHTTDEVSAILKEELSVLYEEGARSGRIMNVGTHPHVSGRAYRIRALDEFLAYATSLEDVWWTTREELADWYRGVADDHFPQPADVGVGGGR